MTTFVQNFQLQLLISFSTPFHHFTLQLLCKIIVITRSLLQIVAISPPITIYTLKRCSSLGNPFPLFSIGTEKKGRHCTSLTLHEGKWQLFGLFRAVTMLLLFGTVLQSSSCV